MKITWWIILFQVTLSTLIPKSDISQLGLIGNLYEHFNDFHAGKDHQSGLIHFLDFIIEHYGDADHEHSDEKTHNHFLFNNISDGTPFLPAHTTSINHNPDLVAGDGNIAIFKRYKKEFFNTIDHPPSA